MEKILVVAAHPDDEILGCGGTIARYSKSGSAVYCLILGEGAIARYPNRKKVCFKRVEILKRQAKISAGIIGIKKIFFSGFPDNSFDTIPILKIVKEIERIKENIRPAIIYTHHYGDLNVDHCVTYNAVLTACRPIKGETVKEIYAFGVPSSTEWAGPGKGTHFIPDTFVDISQTIDKKIAALRCYKTEIRPYPHPRSIKGIKLLAAKLGLEAGLRFAESFETIRTVIA